MSEYCIEPKSRKDLRLVALRIREACGLRDCLYFPIVDFMEHIMPKMFDNYNFEIIEDDKLPPNQDAVTVIENGFGTVRIKQSVYEGACDGNGQHRMTIAHEVVGHFIPMCVLGFEFYRSFGDEEIEAFRDPEWQGLILLLNQLFAMVIAVNGIKIAANIRTGDESSIRWMQSIPKGVMCASGFLGCRNQMRQSDMAYISKLMFFRPSKLLVYGKNDKCIESQMDMLGVNYRVYPDYHRLCKGGDLNGRY